jgi:hypothetical protein
MGFFRADYLKGKGIRFGGKPLGRPKTVTEANWPNFADSPSISSRAKKISLTNQCPVCG